MATPRYPPDQGGTEIHTREVAQRLSSLGVDVTVLCTALREPFARVTDDGQVRVVRVRAWPPNRDFYLAPSLAGHIRRADVDLVHCQGYHTLVAPLAMLSALVNRIPYVVTLHSGGHSSGMRRAMRPIQARLLRPLLRRARAIVAVSQFEADLFAGWLRLPSSAFTVIPSGVDLPPFPSVAPPSDETLLLCIGRLERYKGHHRVIEALPVVRRARPDVRLRIAGTGPYEAELRRLAGELGVADVVELAPVAADRRDELAALLQRAAVVATLSEYESQGLAVQEALALGRPLVVSDTTALSELERYPNVRALPPEAGPSDVADAILELLDAPPVERPRLSTWDDCASSLLHLYETALGSSA